MKEDVVEFTYSCLTCRKLKIEYQKLLGLMQPMNIPEWKWDNILMILEAAWYTFEYYAR